ncbi:MAG: site-specific DNA-methyltransferase [Epsilonproteobacteria bacterium]|nr:MAG: site-specific DNA-methyltransferase [Campylobacterota bacterium]
MIDKFLNKITIGNSLDILKTIPSECVDMGVTSPPYNKKESNKGWLVNKVIYENFVDKTDEITYQQNQTEVLDELYRVIKPGGSFFYNHKIRWDKGVMSHPMDWLRQTKWLTRQEIIWDRTIAANIRGWRFWQVEERIYWLYKPKDDNNIGNELNSKHALLTSIWRFAPERDNAHPAPFPIELPTRAIYSILDKQKNSVIIDPYMGSGTTAIASKLLGHSYIGIDISTHYKDMFTKRLANITKDKLKFNEEINKHIVKKTFKQRKENRLFTGKYQNNKAAVIQNKTQKTFF